MAANHGQEQWRWVTYFDSESDLAESDTSIRHTPKLICASFLDRERGLRRDVDFDGGGCSRLFYQTLSDSVYAGTTVRVIGHNVGYDIAATGGIAELVRLGWRVESLYEKGLTYILRLQRDGKRNLVFLSSTQYWNVRLAKLGELFGLAKLGGEGSAAGYLHSGDKLREYCRRDVEIVLTAMEWLQKFVYDNNLGGMAATLPSLASKAFRHRFMPYAPVIHNYEPVLVLERAAYHGGRTEAWWLGKLSGMVHKVDVNAMYPAAMRREQHPYKLVRLYPTGTCSQLLNLMERFFVIADVTVDTSLPCLPLKDSRLGKLVFPTGSFKTVLTSHELSLLNPASIRQVRAIACYERGDIFSSFVHFFYSERLKAKAAGEEAKAEMLKLVMNALYGKFGQKSTEWVRVGEADPTVTRVEDILLPDGSELKLRTFGGATWMNDGAVMESFDSFPAIAASVTSAARASLWSYILQAGVENVFYMDTDSLFVNDAGLERLKASGSLDEAALGKLKLEKSSNDVEIFGAKNYRFGTETRHKGIPKDAKIVETADGPRAQVWVWPKSATWLREGNLGGFENRLVLKTLTTTYDKGVVEKNGRVTPLVLNEP